MSLSYKKKCPQGWRSQGMTISTWKQVQCGKGINCHQFARLYPQPERVNVNYSQDVALHKYDDLYLIHTPKDRGKRDNKGQDCMFLEAFQRSRLFWSSTDVAGGLNAQHCVNPLQANRPHDSRDARELSGEMRWGEKKCTK